MDARQKKPAEFDSFASNYEELLRDPLRERFTRTNEFFFERKIQVIRSFYKRMGVNPQGLTWLDVGCGRGDLLKAGRDYFGGVAGCDLSEQMLASCSGFETRHQSHEDRLPFEDSLFDFVTAVCVYHHVPDERRLVLTREMKRVLKPGGVLCIIEHNPLNPLTRLIVSRSPVDVDAHLLRLSRVKQLFAEAGSTFISVTYFLIFPQGLYSYLGSIENRLSFVPFGGQYAAFARNER